jgi:hypothetical protein
MQADGARKVALRLMRTFGSRCGDPDIWRAKSFRLCAPRPGDDRYYSDCDITVIGIYSGHARARCADVRRTHAFQSPTKRDAIRIRGLAVFAKAARLEQPLKVRRRLRDPLSWPPRKRRLAAQKCRARHRDAEARATSRAKEEPAAPICEP